MSNVRTPTAGQTLTLDQFLRDPRIDEKPYLEYVDGRVEAKVPPQKKHSLLPGVMVTFLNAYAVDRRLGRAFTELRCTFAGRSIVPDVVLLTDDQIALDEEGEPVDETLVAPALHIEVLSPRQGLKQPRERLAFSTSHGTELGWLFDPGRRKAEVFLPGRPPAVLAGRALLPVDPVLPGMVLSVDQVFGWLRLDLGR